MSLEEVRNAAESALAKTSTETSVDGQVTKQDSARDLIAKHRYAAQCDAANGSIRKSIRLVNQRSAGPIG